MSDDVTLIEFFGLAAACVTTLGSKSAPTVPVCKIDAALKWDSATSRTILKVS